MAFAIDSAEVVDLYGRPQNAAAPAEPPVTAQANVAPVEAAPEPLNLKLPAERDQAPARALVNAPRARYSVADGLKATAKIGVGTAAGVAAVAKMYPGEPDKVLHAAAGGIVAGLAAEYVRHETGDPLKAALAGVLAAIAAGAAKEALDAVTSKTKGYGHVSKHDFLATVAGGIPVSLIYTIHF